MVAISAIIALVLFVLAAFGVEFGAIDIVSLGLAFIALTLLLSALPVPSLMRNKTQ